MEHFGLDHFDPEYERDTGIDRPAGQALRDQDRLAGHIQPALTMLLTGVPVRPSTVNATGVFVRLRDRFFIFTAGHCVRDLEPDIRAGRFGLGLLHTRRGIAPAVVGTHRAVEHDVGVIELAAVDVRNLRDRSTNHFLRQNELLVGPVSEVAHERDAYLIAGYPGILVETEADGAWRMQMGGMATIVAARLPDPVDGPTRCIEILYLDSGGVDMKTRQPLPTIDLGGASGGGCWAARLARDEWTLDRLRLIAIHVGRVPCAGGARLREVLVGHHLALLARDAAGMAWLFDDYPCLEGW